MTIFRLKLDVRSERQWFAKLRLLGLTTAAAVDCISPQLHISLLKIISLSDSGSGLPWTQKSSPPPAHISDLLKVFSLKPEIGTCIAYFQE